MKISGKWDYETLSKYLENSLYPVRLSLITTSGYPLVISMWYIFENGIFWCAAQKDSSLVSIIANNDKCGFEVAPNEPPYMGVRGRGIARLFEEKGEEKLKQLIERYLDKKNNSLADWLLSRSSQEVAIKIRPECFYTWDYSSRMK